MRNNRGTGGEGDIIGILRNIPDLSHKSLISRDGKSKERKQRKIFSKCFFISSPLFIRKISQKCYSFF